MVSAGSMSITAVAVVGPVPNKPWVVLATEEYEASRAARTRKAYLKSRAGISERLRFMGVERILEYGKGKI
jgi:hypothetical protein